MERLDQYIIRQFKKIPKECMIAFFSALIFGLFAHNYMLTNKLPNYDDMGVTGFGATFRLGRWFLWVLGAAVYHFDLSYSLPWFNGMISLILIAVSVALLVSVFQLKNKISVIVFAGLLIVFPSWTATFFFMFTVPYYAIALLLGVLGIFFVVKYPKGYIGGIVCTVLSLGIYQAFFPFIASLYVIVLIQKLLSGKYEAKEIIKKSFWYLAILLLAMICYAIITQITLAVTGQQMASYRGLEDVSDFSVKRILSSFREIFACFYHLCIDNGYEISNNLILRAGFGISFLLWLGESILCLRVFLRKSQKLESICFVVLTLALFISIGGIYIMCPQKEAVYLLMRYAYALVPIYPLVLMDSSIAMVGNERKMVFCENISILVIFCMTFSYCHFANAQYLSMELSLKQAIGFYTPIITQIKSLEGFDDTTEVIFVKNNQSEITDGTLYCNDVMRIFDVTGRDSILAQTGSLRYLLSLYCGFQPKEFSYLLEKDCTIEEVKNMPSYPQNGSIQMIDGKAVVRLSR